MKHRVSIISKFNILTTSLVLITALGIASFVIYQDMIDNYEQLLQHGAAVASMVAQNSEYAIYTEDQEAVLHLVKSLSVDADIAYVAALNHNKEVLVYRLLYPKVPIPTLSERKPVRSDQSIFFKDFVNAADGRPYIDILAPVVSISDHATDALFTERAPRAKSPQTIGYIQIGLSLEGLQARIWKVFRSTLTFIALLGLAGILITIVMTRRIVSPLQQLAAVTRDISAGNLDHRIDIDTHDEINDLACAFQHMLTRLRDYRKQVAVYQEDLEAKKEAAEAASLAKSQFLAAMSHEIRTPMNGVLGMTELLQGTQLTDKQRRFVDTVHSSGEALLMIINDILDFSKIEAGKLELENIAFDLRQVAEEVTELFAERAHGKGIELACHVYPEVPTAVKGDPHRLRQICINLIGNALKFTERGEVVMTITQLEETQETSLIRFAVRDTGIGISAEAQSHIFESFSQADGSTTRKYGGTGLGLSISKQLAALMGGTLDVESEVGVGSTFWWTACFEKQPGQAQHSQTVPSTLHGVRVLIVDDNATHRAILEHHITSWGMQPSSAASGPAALSLLAQAVAQGVTYDIAILDMQMPEMNGVQLAQALQADSSLCDIQRVMLTSDGQSGDRDAAQRARCSGSVSKPVRQSDLLACLSSIMDVRAAHASKATASGGTPPHVQATVLLAEDNPVNQEVAFSMLDLLGCHVDVVSNGHEAIEATAATHYDIILMDCQMPDIDGFEATKTIRDREALMPAGPHSHVPIIALTANAMHGDRERCLAAGMDDYVSKPFTKEKLQAILAHWCPQPTGEQKFRGATQAAPATDSSSSTATNRLAA